jgi:hypothetical protein
MDAVSSGAQTGRVILYKSNRQRNVPDGFAADSA